MMDLRDRICVDCGRPVGHRRTPHFKRVPCVDCAEKRPSSKRRAPRAPRIKTERGHIWQAQKQIEHLSHAEILDVVERWPQALYDAWVDEAERRRGRYHNVRVEHADRAAFATIVVKYQLLGAA